MPSTNTADPATSPSVTLVSLTGSTLTVAVGGALHRLEWTRLDGPYADRTDLDDEVLEAIDAQRDAICAMDDEDAASEWMAYREGLVA